ncbi:MAG: hypothetical protein QXU32_00675 [Nitrososphaerales archaeon]
MPIAKEPYSRFNLSEPILFNGEATFGMIKRYPFLDPANLSDNQIISVQVTPELAGKPWMIADKLYNSPILDWVIVLFNKPINPVNWPHAGTIIKAPTESVVLPNV